MADANRPLSQAEIDALLDALSNSDTLDGQNSETSEPEKGSAPVAAEEESEAAPPSAASIAERRAKIAATDDPRLQRALYLPVTMQVSLGGKSVPVKSLLSWGVGTQIVLNHDWQNPVGVKINGFSVGHGRVVLVGDNFGIEITDWGRE